MRDKNQYSYWLIFAARILSYVVNMAALGLISRLYPLNKFGALSLSVSVATLTSAFVSIPSYQNMVRFFPYNEPEKYQRQYLGSKLWEIPVELTFSFLLSLGLALAATSFLNINQYFWPLETAAFAAIYGLQISLTGAMRATESQGILELILLLDPIGRSILVFYSSRTSISLTGCYVISTLISTSCCLGYLVLNHKPVLRIPKLNLRLARGRDQIDPQPRRYSYRSAWIYSSVAIWLQNNSDKMILQSFFGLSVVGSYSFLLQLFYSPVVVATNQLLAVVEPTLFKETGFRGGSTLITTITNKSKPYIHLLPAGVAFFACYPFLAQSVLNIQLGIAVGWTYLVMSCGFLYFVSQILVIEIKKHGSFRHILITVALPGVLGLAMNALLISALGIIGAVLSLFMALLLKLILSSSWRQNTGN